MTRLSPTEVLARWAFAVLVLLTFGALFVTQRLKHVPPLVSDPRMPHFFSPFSSVRPDERISFKVKNADDVTVTILNADGTAVATLAHDVPVAAYHKLSLRWNGHAYSGTIAPAGTYQVQVHLRRQDRTIILSRTFQLRALSPAPATTSTTGSEGTAP